MHGLLHRLAKVMVLHAGGYSQRLPNVSVIGKVFMALPCCCESLSLPPSFPPLPSSPPSPSPPPSLLPSLSLMMHTLTLPVAHVLQLLLAL